MQIVVNPIYMQIETHTRTYPVLAKVELCNVCVGQPLQLMKFIPKHEQKRFQRYIDEGLAITDVDPLDTPTGPDPDSSSPATV